MKKAILLMVAFAMLVTIVLALQFQPAQTEAQCNTFSYSDCPSRCVVCPPCAVCSSVSCQNESFCASMGFDRQWAGNISGGLGK